MSFHPLALAPVLLWMVACTEVAPIVPPIAPPLPPADLSTCGGTAFSAMIGLPVVDLQLAGLPPGARIIRPGDAVTEDYSLQRLNVMLDGRDRVTSLTCG